jgi:hypothetical protein
MVGSSRQCERDSTYGSKLTRINDSGNGVRDISHRPR